MSKVTDIIADVARIDRIESTADAATSNITNVDNTADLDKPISTATQTAIDLKAPKANPIFTGTVTAPIIDGAKLTQSSYAQIADATVSTTATHTFNYANGDRQQLTIGGDTVTIAFSNFPTGKVCTMIIDAVNWGAWTPVFPAGLVGTGKVFPTFTEAGTDRLMVEKDKDDVYSLFVIGQDVGTMV